MKLSLLATACVALAQASCVTATYFTSPQSGDTISNAAGLKVTWKYQPGGAPKGTIILETVEPSAQRNTQVVIASNVDLVNTASLTLPNNLNARKSSTNTYKLLIVNAADVSTIYAQAAPLTIKSFGFSGSGDASTTTSKARTTTETTQATATTTRKSIALSTTTAAAVETSPLAAASTPSTTSTTTTTTTATTSTADAVVVVTSYAPIVTVLESSSSEPAANVVTVVLTTMAPQSSSSPTSTGLTSVVGVSAQSQASAALASKAFVGGASFVAIFLATIALLC